MFGRRRRERKEERKAPITAEPSVLCVALPMPVCIELSKAVRESR